jgi:hypothetical protein
MLVVIAVNFCMAVEAHRDRIRDTIIATLRRWSDVVGFDLHAAETVADAAPSLASYQQRGDIVSIEWHRCYQFLTLTLG